MRIKLGDWIVFLLIAVLSFQIWAVFSYPHFSQLDLSVNRFGALKSASEFLRQDYGVDTSAYRSAVAFSSDGRADRYLQKVLGFESEQKFLAENNFELFFWLIRFFKEGSKEEFRITVSPSDGRILAYKHTLEDSVAKPDTTQEEAKAIAIAMLQQRFGFDPDAYASSTNTTSKRDFRTDYAYVWKRKDINLLWNNDPKSGGAKLLTGATVAGNEITSFYRTGLEIPNQFNRYLDSKREGGRNLSLVFKIFYLGLLAGAIMLVVNRRNHLAMNTTKNFYFGCVVFIFGMMCVEIWNYFEMYLFDYQTTQPLLSYLTREIIHQLINGFFFTIGFMMPCLAGELVHYEVRPQLKEQSFLYYVHSTFFSRAVTQRICLGYLVAMIMFGLQSLMFEMGYRYFDVWVENTWLNEFSTAYLPFLAAFLVAIKAGFTEEIIFRLFSISWGIKIFKNVVMAGAIASIIWGFGHTGYDVYPMWFRGLEVSVLGFFLSFVYWRYGIITTFVAHFLFDACWGSAAYILGRSEPFNFYTSIAVLLIPMVWALVSWIMNRSATERPLVWSLNKSQKQNIEILKAYLEKQVGQGASPSELKKEMLKLGWDVAVIDVAFEPYLPSAS